VQETLRRINDTGLLVRGRGDEPRPNPLLRIHHRADRAATTLAREFGLTLASRKHLLPKVDAR
jgi:phage terminase small subunit